MEVKSPRQRDQGEGLRTAVATPSTLGSGTALNSPPVYAPSHLSGAGQSRDPGAPQKPRPMARGPAVTPWRPSELSLSPALHGENMGRNPGRDSHRSRPASFCRGPSPESRPFVVLKVTLTSESRRRRTAGKQTQTRTRLRALQPEQSSATGRKVFFR